MVTGVMVPERTEGIALLSSYNRCFDLSKTQKLLKIGVVGDQQSMGAAGSSYTDYFMATI